MYWISTLQEAKTLPFSGKSILLMVSIKFHPVHDGRSNSLVSVDNTCTGTTFTHTLYTALSLGAAERESSCLWESLTTFTCCLPLIRALLEGLDASPSSPTPPHSARCAPYLEVDIWVTWFREVEGSSLRSSLPYIRFIHKGLYLQRGCGWWNGWDCTAKHMRLAAVERRSTVIKRVSFKIFKTLLIKTLYRKNIGVPILYSRWANPLFL